MLIYTPMLILLVLSKLRKCINVEDKGRAEEREKEMI